MKSNARAIFLAVMACFFVSGVAGLVYQLAWARYLALFLGHTSYAVVAVLVAFMGGLAIGNAALGRVADRAEKPLALYGWLELGIAGYALIFPWYFEFCHNLYIAFSTDSPNGGAPMLALKFAFSFLTILLPTTLMGATFPALTKFVTQSLAELREKVAALYFINSVGAVVGCVVADFWWIPNWGLEFSTYGAAALNFVAALVAFGISRSILEGTPTAARAGSGKSANDEVFSALDLKVATIGIGLSGFVAMLYEVAWTRLLALALGSSTHAFSIMLITFISGIAVGAAIIARWKTLRRTLDAFAWAEAALAGTVLFSMFFYERMPFWFARLGGMLARRPDVYFLYELSQGAICFAVMFIPAVCLGMTLPLASRIATSEFARTGRSVGRIFAVNTVGTVFGAAMTGLWLMPMIGLPGVFALGVAINAAIAAVILKRETVAQRPAPILATGFLAALGLVFVATYYFEPLWRGSFSQGVWRSRAYASTFEQFRDAYKLYHFLYYKDGPGSTVALHTFGGDPNNVILRVNAKTDASLGDAGTQLILGHLPALMHTKATNALVIGLGSGMTASALLRHTNILQTRVVEISPQVAEALPLWGAANDNVATNARFRLTIDDAKSFLKASEQQFDIIVSEPSNPWMAGVASVFSKEFYESCRRRLNSDGVMVQWVQTYETTDRTIETVIKTFAGSFPYVSLWRGSPGDIVLVGTPQPRKINLDSLLARMTDPHVRTDLMRGRMSEPLALLAREIVSDQNTMFLPRTNAVIHSDYFPTLEYMSQVGFFIGADARLHEVIDETKVARPTTLLGELLKRRPLDERDFQRASQAYLDGQFTDATLALSLMLRWAETHTNSTLPLEMIERIPAERPAAITEEMRLAPKHAWLLEQARTDIAALQFYERALMRAYRSKRTAFYSPDTKKLEEVLSVLIERDPRHVRVYKLHQSELAWDKGDDEASLRLGGEALSPNPQLGPVQFTLDHLAPRQVLCNMIEASIRSGELRQAQELAMQARAGKYVEPGEFYFPPLDFVCRKTEVLIEQAQTRGVAK